MKRINIKKSDIKGFLRVVAVALVFVIILQALSFGYFSKLNATTYKNYFTRAYSFLTEPDNSIDVAAIGSSDLYTAFVPGILFEEKGITATVISSPHQSTLKSYKFLKELLKTQSPKLLVIETDMLYENAPEFNPSDAKQSLYDKYRQRLESPFNSLDYQEFDNSVVSDFSVFRFHDGWKKADLKALFSPNKKEKPSTIDHGYNFNDSVKAGKANSNMEKTDIAEPIPQEDLRYLNKMLSLCEKNGIRVVLAEMPTQNSWNYYRHNAVQAYADENSIEFVDFNLLFDELGFDITADYRDGGDHCNYYGASKVTLYFSDIIKLDYFPDAQDKRQNPDYAYWTESIKEFKEKYKV